MQTETYILLIKSNYSRKILGPLLIKIRSGIVSTIYASLKEAQNQKCIEIVFM
jgi:hypothetical protein